jgi:hypothetical protein
MNLSQRMPGGPAVARRFRRSAYGALLQADG